MTVSSEASKSGPYIGNGVTTVFPYDFRIASDAHVRVVREQDGFEETLSLGPDYTVSGVGDEGGGSIVLAVALLSSQSITIVRDVPFTQETDLENQGPYYAETVEAALDLAAMRDQQLAERVSRAVMVPLSDATYDPDQFVNDVRDVPRQRQIAESAASALGNQVHQYDTRALAIAATIPVGVQAVKVTRWAAGYPLSVATYVPGTSAGPVAFQEAGGHWWELDLSGGVVDPRWFGAKGDGVADDTTALQAALTRAVDGNDLYVPPGTWAISASLDGGAGNVRISGAGKNRSVIKVLGSNVVDPMLKFTDASDVVVDGLEFFGNSITVDIGAIQFLVTSGSGVVGGYLIQHNRFRNFRAHYWVRFLTNVLATPHTRCMRYVRVLNNDWMSQSGNAVDFTAVGQPSACIGVQGSIDNSASYVDDVIVSGNLADCGAIKTFLQCWSGSRNVLMDSNFVLNAGALGNNDRGCYATIAYNNHATGDMAFAPQDITITNNTIISARTCGFYGAQVVRPNVSYNKISGVQDPSTSLPYGAISFNGCEEGRANFNELSENYMGVYMIPNSVSTSLEAIENKIVSHVANSTGVLARTLGSFVNKAKVIGNEITLTASGTIGIACYSVGSGFEWDRVEIAGNSILTGGYGISISDTTDGHTRGNILTLRDNHVTGAFSDSAVVFGPGSTIRTLVIGGSIDLANAAGLATGFVAAGHANLNIDGLKILNRATGSALAYSASSAKGTVRNVNFIAVARANLPADGSGHMGFQAPTGVPAAGISAFVQCLATSYYTPSGGFTIEGWASDGTNWTAKKAAA